MPLMVSDDLIFNDQLKKHEKVIVKYYADWCGSCKLFAPKFRRIAGEDKFKEYTFLDINAEKNPEARKAGNVKNLPTFAIFKNGTLIESLSTNKEEAVLELLEKLN